MGQNNAGLMRASERARKSGDAEELARLSKLIDDSQERCKHLAANPSKKIEKESRTGKYQVGGTIHWCILCGKVTKYMPPEVNDGDAKEEGSQ